ncbi:MAG: M48 family metallopeptidase [Lysobacteraceae bacterium]
MNFFEHQDAARKQSKRLIVLFVLAVIGIVVSIDVALVFGLGVAGKSPGEISGFVAMATLATLAVIGISSMVRTAGLRGGGGKVAVELGATPVAEDTSDFQYRRLRNVVEEIAIASGVPVPQIYVMEAEAGINAFASGWAPTDAAVTVTRGALDHLNRDELQGVIAHEFSHVLNGDMRLNLRLIGVLFGILVLGIIGRKVLFTVRGGRDAKSAAPILIIALVITIVGYVGVFFGRLIKAGVSRQREYLADASAVQFTRQTNGIAGALKKIGGLANGSKIVGADGEEMSHMFFGDGVGYSALFATHPPLVKRIKALDPSFNAGALGELARRWAQSAPDGAQEDRLMGLDGSSSSRLPSLHAQLPIVGAAVVAQVGTPHDDDYRRAGAISDSMPAELDAAARSLEQAIPLVLALLLDSKPEVRGKQENAIVQMLGDGVLVKATSLAPTVAQLHPMLRLPLAALAFPLLRRRPRPELQSFIGCVNALVQADGEVSLFEYCMGCLLRKQLTESLDPSAHWSAGRKKVRDVQAEIVTLLSVLAENGQDTAVDARRAFAEGIGRVLHGVAVAYAPPADGVRALDAVWPALDALDSVGKVILIEGLVATISMDGKVTVAESELLRTVCAVLHCPLPPMLERA